MEILPASQYAFPKQMCALQQAPDYARAISNMGADVQAFVAHARGDPIARFQIVSRKMGPVMVRWLPRGPVWSDLATPDDRQTLLRTLPYSVNLAGAWILAADCIEDAKHMRATPLLSAQHVAEIDLTLTPAARLARQHVKWRNRLRHAERAGLDVTHRPLNSEKDGPVITKEVQQQHQRRYKNLPPAFLLAWMHSNPKAHRLFEVKRGAETLAHMVILLHAPVATYHIGWTGPTGRKLSAHNLALWTVANWLSRKGYTRLDLGSVDTENTPGLARFKIGSGAQVRALAPTSLYIPRFSLPHRKRHIAA